MSDNLVVFCDSLESLVKAKQDNLISSAIIRTSSPDLAFSGHPGVVPLFGAGHETQLYRYMETGGDLARSVYEDLIQIPELKHYAILVARTAYGVHKQVVKMTTLTEEDFTEPRLVISSETGDTEFNQVLNPPWMRFLAKNRHATEYFVKVNGVRKQWANLPFRFYLRNKLNIQFDDLVWKFASFSNQILKKKNAPKAMIVIGGKLVFDTVGHMFFRGFTIDHFVKSFREMNKMMDKCEEIPIENTLFEKLEARLKTKFEVLLDSWFIPSLHTPLRELLREQLRTDTTKFNSATHLWSQHLSERKPSIVFCRTPQSPELIALADACAKMAIPLVVGQHGVSREIEDSYHRCRSIILENSVLDLTLSYNAKSVEADNISPFRKGDSIAVGLSCDYHRAKRKAVLNKRFPILYVSTTLYAGNFNVFKGGYTDIDRAKLETHIIDEVLSKTGHGVIYKTYHYGTARYVEDKLLQKCVERHPNIKLLDEPAELTDIALKQYRLIITSRATSSMAWCLMADRPLVFIDIPFDCPFQPQAKEQLDKAVFLFSVSDPEFLDKLQHFFNRPLDNIEEEWKSKASARYSFMNDYVEGPGKGAGARAAKYIHRWLDNKLS